MIRDQILSAHRTVKPISVPEWGSIFVRVLSMSERLRIGELAAEKNPKVMAWVCVYGVAEADGSRAFTDEDLDQLHDGNYLALEAAADAIIDLNGMGSSAIEDAKKNSPMNDDSGSS